MKKRNVVIIALTSLFLLTGFSACRHGRYGGGFDEFDLEAATKRIASRLDLTEAQQEELREIAGEIAAKAKAMHGNQEVRHRELAELVRQETIGRETVDRMIAEKWSRIQELADFAAPRLIAFHATLTPEQREKIAGQIEEHATTKCRFFRR